jgi:multiple sugar transport system ATP-binding protein
MASVTIKNVKKSYGAAKTIHGVSIDIEDGEFVVLVGPSGCGKSTLLRMLAGLEEISDGEIMIGPRRVNDLPAKERDIAMVFQNYALYPHMNVAENMGFALRLKNAAKAEIERRVKPAADILGLTDLLDRFPRQLSGGQRQRVAMGRAIVRDPKVFLFDEPLSNLDAKLRVSMRAEIKNLHKRLGTTIVYVTHDQIEAMTMADKIVVMRDGRVEQIGAPLDLYDRPANTFVASFIGSPAMNFIKGRVDASGVFQTPDGHRLPVPLGVAGPLPGEVIYGVRPEHVRIAAGGVPLEIQLVEPTGSEVMVSARLGSQEISCLFRERLSLHPGETIHVAFESRFGHLFDGATGLRLSPDQSALAA